MPESNRIVAPEVAIEATFVNVFFVLVLIVIFFRLRPFWKKNGNRFIFLSPSGDQLFYRTNFDFLVKFSSSSPPQLRRGPRGGVVIYQHPTFILPSSKGRRKISHKTFGSIRPLSHFSKSSLPRGKNDLLGGMGFKTVIRHNSRRYLLFNKSRTFPSPRLSSVKAIKRNALRLCPQNSTVLRRERYGINRQKRKGALSLLKKLFLSTLRLSIFL